MVKVHSPLPENLGNEFMKSASIVEHFIKGKTKLDQTLIPPKIIANCKGIAILTLIKAGFVWTGRAGAGLVVARLPDGRWSAPSAIAAGGAGFGAQIGAELTDCVFILNTDGAVRAFSHGGNVTFGANLSIAAGPTGRSAEGAGTLANLAPIYAYSKTKGLFAGLSIEGLVIITRKETNATFYGRKVSPSELLTGQVEPPAQADVLYRALNYRGFGTRWENGREVWDPNSDQPDAESSVEGGSSSSSTRTRSGSAGASAPGGGTQKSLARMKPPPLPPKVNPQQQRPGTAPQRPPPPKVGGASGPTAESATATMMNATQSTRGSSSSGPPPIVPVHPSKVQAGGGPPPGIPQTAPPVIPRGGVATGIPPKPAHLASTTGIPPRPNVPSKPARLQSPTAAATTEAKEDTVVALYDFKPQRDGDLGFARGDTIIVLERGMQGDDGWWRGKLRGNVGVFPSNYVE